jgi:uncharacterized surface protein with fasciclin (FAS1) repeats
VKSIINLAVLGALVVTSPLAAQHPAPGHKQGHDNTIVAVAAQAGSFNTLTAALKASGLDAVLKGDGPFTVFAPTDAAFAKLPAGTVEALLADVPKLKQILLYHVAAGKVTAADVVKLDRVKTVQGQSLDVNAREGVRIGTAKVVKADVPASNGVIHVIDTVLLPR